MIPEKLRFVVAEAINTASDLYNIHLKKIFDLGRLTWQLQCFHRKGEFLSPVLLARKPPSKFRKSDDFKDDNYTNKSLLCARGNSRQVLTHTQTTVHYRNHQYL